MKKQKLSLEALKVKSFITQQQAVNLETIKGGVVAGTSCVCPPQFTEATFCPKGPF